jgi:hypothetical protein
LLRFGFRVVTLCAFGSVVLLVLHWVVLIVIAQQLSARVTQDCEVGSNGLAIRILCHNDPTVSIAWDALGTEWQFNKHAFGWYVQIPVITTFAVSLGLLVATRVLKARIDPLTSRREQQP